MILVAAAMFMVACGNSGEKKQQTVEEKVVKQQTVEEKVVEYNEKMLKVLESGDEAAFEKISSEGEAWMESLSAEDKEKAEAAARKWEEDNMDRIYKAMGL